MWNNVPHAGSIIEKRINDHRSSIIICMATDTADHGFAPARSFAAVAHSVITVK
jgi:hypothetical protein